MMLCPNDLTILKPDNNGLYQCPNCIFNAGGNTKKMKELYAWVSVDKEGMEGLLAARMPNGTMMMLANSNRITAERLKSVAVHAISSVPGYRTRLLRFKNVEVVIEG